MIYEIINSNKNMDKIKNFKKGEIVISQGEDPKNIEILLSGEVYISKFSAKGDRIITNILREVQFFGLIEKLNNENSNLSSVICLSNCDILSVPSNIFLKQMNSDPRLMKLCLNYLSSFSLNLIKDMEKHQLTSKKDNMLEFFYFSSLSKNFPIEIDTPKEFLADFFQINIRTLYRYLKDWEKREIIKRQGQSIIIDEDSFEKIKKLLLF